MGGETGAYYPCVYESVEVKAKCMVHRFIASKIIPSIHFGQFGNGNLRSKKTVYNVLFDSLNYRKFICSNNFRYTCYSI